MLLECARRERQGQQCEEPDFVGHRFMIVEDGLDIRRKRAERALRVAAAVGRDECIDDQTRIEDGG